MNKKVFVLLVCAVLFVSGMAFAAITGDDVSPGIGDKLGQGKMPSDAHKIFRLVRYMPQQGANANAEIVSPDSIVIWDLTSDDGVTVTLTTVSGDSAVAGILVNGCLTPETVGKTAAEDIGKRHWNWMQTYGPSEVNMQIGGLNIPVGGAFGCSAANGQATGFVGTAGVTTAQGMAGFVLDDVTSTGLAKEVFLRGLD